MSKSDDAPRPQYFMATPSNKDFDGDYLTFGNKFYNGQIEEIYGPDILDSIEYDNLKDMLQSWHNLLMVDGTICIGGIDPYLISKNFVTRQIDESMINGVISQATSLVSIKTVKTFLEKLGMKIQSVDLSYTDFTYTIKAIKK